VLAKGGGVKKRPVDPTRQEPSSIDNPEKHQAFLMFLSGWSAEEIADRCELSFDMVRKWVERGGWVKRRKEFQGLWEEKHPLREQPIPKAVAKSDKGALKKKFVETMGEIAADDVEHWKNLDAGARLSVATDIVALAGHHRRTFDLDKEEAASEKGHISLTFLTQSSEPGFVKLLEPEKVKEIEDAPKIVEEVKAAPVKKVYTMDDF
jgi:hypothetical protein